MVELNRIMSKKEGREIEKMRIGRTSEIKKCDKILALI
jgi:hypothetical protein